MGRLRPLVVELIDPKLLRVALGPEVGPVWASSLQHVYDAMREMQPTDFHDVDASWKRQRGYWRSILRSARQAMQETEEAEAEGSASAGAHGAVADVTVGAPHADTGIEQDPRRPGEEDGSGRRRVRQLSGFGEAPDPTPMSSRSYRRCRTIPKLAMSAPNMTTSSIVVALHGAHPVKHRSSVAPAVAGSPTSFRRGLPPVDGPRRVVRSCAVPAPRQGAGARSLPPGALVRPIPGRRSFSSWRPCCIRRKLWIAFGGSGLRAVQPRLHGTVGPCRRLSPRSFANVSVELSSDRQIFASRSRRSFGVVVTLRLRSWPAIATVHRRPVSGSADLRGGLLSRSGGRGSQSPSEDRSRPVPSPPSQGR